MTDYQQDLAYIHDTGYGDFSRSAGNAVLALLRERGVTGGLVVDLGCGSGIWAAEALRSGYQVFGVDASAAMIELARRRAPGATFVEASYLDIEIPPCVAVTAFGEILNYACDPGVFERIAASLQPGGLFVFDVIEPGLLPEGEQRRTWGTGQDWATLVETEEREGDLTRRIITFRRIGDVYRRSDEVHHQRLVDRAKLIAQLHAAGFRVQVIDRYGDRPMLPGRIAFIAER